MLFEEKPKARQFYKTYLDAVKAGYYKGWSKAELLVWKSLNAHEHRKTKRCDPSYEVIHNETGLTREHIYSGLQKLQKRGALKIEKVDRPQGGKRNVYTLIHPEPQSRKGT